MSEERENVQIRVYLACAIALLFYPYCLSVLSLSFDPDNIYWTSCIPRIREYQYFLVPWLYRAQS